MEINIQYRKNLNNAQNDLNFLPERMKIQNVEKVVASLHDKNEYVVHIKNLKQALSYGLVLKKFIKSLRLIKACG